MLDQIKMTFYSLELFIVALWNWFWIQTFIDMFITDSIIIRFSDFAFTSAAFLEIPIILSNVLFILIGIVGLSTSAYMSLSRTYPR